MKEIFIWFHEVVVDPPQICLGLGFDKWSGIWERQETSMKVLFAGFLLATTCCTSVWAAEFSPASKIDAVTVFPQGADVVREVAIDVPAGEHGINTGGFAAKH